MDTAHAAATLFLKRYPNSDSAPEVENQLHLLRTRQIENAYARARYYDKILRNPTAALMEYKAFVALYPNAEQAPKARARIAKLESSEKE